jgi:hypothetical protein
MKKNAKKLALSKETFRDLQVRGATGVVAAGYLGGFQELATKSCEATCTELSCYLD